MNSFDFRQKMIIEIREFETWAWKDEREHPADWQDMPFTEWFDMFTDYLEDKKND